MCLNQQSADIAFSVGEQNRNRFKSVWHVGNYMESYHQVLLQWNIIVHEFVHSMPAWTIQVHTQVSEWCCVSTPGPVLQQL